MEQDDVEQIAALAILTALDSNPEIANMAPAKARVYLSSCVRNALRDELSHLQVDAESATIRGSEEDDQDCTTPSQILEVKWDSRVSHSVTVYAGVPQSPEPIYTSRPATISLSEPVGDADSNLTLGDVLADERQLNPEEICIKNELSERLSPLMDQLDSFQITILRLRFGFGDDTCRSLRAIGKQLGHTSKQIERQYHRTIDCLRQALQEPAVAVQGAF